MTTTYKQAGVDIDKGNEFIKKIAPHVKATYKPEVLAGVGGFAAHLALNLEEIREPVLVTGTDGVGTKLKIAQAMNRFDTIGIDLVAMCVNDICCSGAKPLFFLDYFAVEKLDPDAHSEIVKGIAAGCQEADCSLVGGETAELPGIYQPGDFDLAGFAVGIIDRSKIVDGSDISIGNTIIGIPSSGFHSNGYSLVRKVIADNAIDLGKTIDGMDESLGKAFLKPTTIYASLIQHLMRDFSIHGIAHITGGGLIENIPRVLPESCQARLSLSSWERPTIFTYLQKMGNITEDEMQRVFNLGIGLAIIVPAPESVEICERMRSLGETPAIIGEITKREADEPHIVLE